MRGSIGVVLPGSIGVVLPGLLVAALAGLLAAGCAIGAPAPHRATPDTCYAYGVQALQRHITVTTVPRACAGLSHAQVNLAAARAIRQVVGPRPKAVARRLANQEGGYLAALINAVPPPRQEPLAAAPSRHSTDVPLSLAALTAWIAAAAAGAHLLAGWLPHDGRRLRRRSRAAGLPPVVIIGHFAVAVAGLGIWIAFAITEISVLAWIAVGLILSAAGLGMAGLAAALPEPAPSAWPPSQRPALATAMAEAASGRVAMPVTVIALHGVLATATILLVLLAAIGAA